MRFIEAAKRILRKPWLRPLTVRLWQLSRDIPRRIPIQRIPILQKWSGRPVGCHLRIADYLALGPGRGWEKVIKPAGSYERARPIPAAGPLPERFEPPQTVSWADERVIFLEGCRYWGGYGGSLIGKDEQLLGELSKDVWGPERHVLFGKLWLPRITDLPGVTAVISTPEADGNYSHWMMDLLPRLALLREAGYGPAQVDRYLVNLGGAPYERETLALAGIPAEKLVPVSAASHFRCEKVVTTSLREHHWQHSLPAWVPAYLRELTGVNQAGVGHSRRLYLSRKTASFRRVLNEAELRPVLEAHGFEIVDPGNLPVREQAALFASAEAIVSPHSSAMTNLVFCRTGIPVLEIFPADYFDVSFWTAASTVQARYYALLGERVGKAPSILIEGRRQDLRIPEPALAKVLDTFAGQARAASAA